MAEEPEKGKQTRSQDEPESKKDTGPSLVETAIPIPDFFYDIRSTLPLVASSHGVVRSLTNFLYLITIGIFVATYVFYSLPAQLLSEESVVTSEWEKEGFTCKPLQKVTIGGLSMDWTFDECIVATSSANTDNIIAVVKSDDASTQFDYRFATQGDSSLVMSIHDDRVASSVLQVTSDGWSRDGFSCFPEPPYDNTFDVPYNYSECIEAIQLPSSQTMRSDEIGISVYHPFGFSKSCYLTEFPSMAGAPSVRDRLSLGYGLTLAGIGSGGSCFGCGIPSECFTVSTQITEDAIDAFNELLSLDSDSHGSFGAGLICGETKQNGNGFRCFDKPKPPTTKEQAIERYTAEYPPETICAPLKQNSPFQCTRTVEAPMVTRMSLSLASAQAVFALVGILFVAILRKMKKPDQAPSTVCDDDLRVLVRKIRDGQGRHEELIQNLLKKAGDHQA